MSEYQQRIGSDRRVHRRLEDLRASLVELGGNNGGIVLNISEGGMAILSAQDLNGNAFRKVRFQAPEFEHWIETNAEIAWISDSKKHAGIRFKSLSEAVRIQLRAGISIAATRFKRANQAKQPATTAEIPEVVTAEFITPSMSESFVTADSPVLVVSESPQVSTEVHTNSPAEKIVEEEHSSHSDIREVASDSHPPVAQQEIETKEKIISSEESKKDAHTQLPNSADTETQKTSALAVANTRLSDLTPQKSALAEIRFRNLVVNSGVKESSNTPEGTSNRADISYGKWAAVGAIAILASLLAFLVGWILGDPTRVRPGH
jgi:hypothetical protein